MSNDAGRDCTTRFENAHRTLRREVLYWLHPWASREVSVHAVIDKADGVVFRCTPDGSETERWLEIPAWMFDRASCAQDQALTTHPFVGLDALMDLSALLDRSMKIAGQSSNTRLSGAWGTSRDQNRGETHGSEDGGVRGCGSTQPAARSASDGPVRSSAADHASGAPAWRELPREAQATLVSLMMQLILEHAHRRLASAITEASHDH